MSSDELVMLNISPGDTGSFAAAIVRGSAEPERICDCHHAARDEAASCPIVAQWIGGLRPGRLRADGGRLIMGYPCRTIFVLREGEAARLPPPFHVCPDAFARREPGTAKAKE